MWKYQSTRNGKLSNTFYPRDWKLSIPGTENFLTLSIPGTENLIQMKMYKTILKWQALYNFFTFLMRYANKFDNTSIRKSLLKILLDLWNNLEMSLIFSFRSLFYGGYSLFSVQVWDVVYDVIKAVMREYLAKAGEVLFKICRNTSPYLSKIK